MTFLQCLHRPWTSVFTWMKNRLDMLKFLDCDGRLREIARIWSRLQRFEFFMVAQGASANLSGWVEGDKEQFQNMVGFDSLFALQCSPRHCWRMAVASYASGIHTAVYSWQGSFLKHWCLNYMFFRGSENLYYYLVQSMEKMSLNLLNCGLEGFRPVKLNCGVKAVKVLVLHQT